jgi:peflin
VSTTKQVESTKVFRRHGVRQTVQSRCTPEVCFLYLLLDSDHTDILRHAEPEQAAQVLGALPGNRRQSSPNSSTPTTHSTFGPTSNRASSPRRRLSPAAIAARQSYTPSPTQASPQYHNPGFQNVSSNQGYGEHYGNNSNISPLHSPPLPSNYGHGPRPVGSVPQHQSPNLPPRTPAPPDPDSADLYPLFQAANASHTGALSSQELGSALVNADYSPFDSYTITMMMRMFSSAPNLSTITYPEFQNLWRFLADWRQLFERFDEDNSGRISLAEFSNALVAFGYRLTQPFVGNLYHTYTDKGRRMEERRGSGGRLGEGMSFDLFVQACISLKKMTDVFKGYDEDRDGYVTLSFEEFLKEILNLTRQ